MNVTLMTLKGNLKYKLLNKDRAAHIYQIKLNLI